MQKEDINANHAPEAESDALKPLQFLIGKHFFIPSYQRGYRWTKRQVTDLLDDIWEFVEREPKEKEEYYCLQPVVLKRRNSEDDSEDSYEVIDGQQRLTTIYLVFKYVESKLDSTVSFKIEYETRPKSWKFLENINAATKPNADEINIDDNIDFHYMHMAYKTITDWFQEKAKNGYEDISMIFFPSFKNKTKIIWYEPDDDQSGVKIFTRINIGKIPLTNAELIKALFLSKAKLPTGNDDVANRRVQLKQLQIATEWDNIENTLQDPSFWHFIYNGDDVYDSRIEYIFELYLKTQHNAKDEYNTFAEFNSKFNDKFIKRPSTEQNAENILDELWQEIKKYFQIFEEWYHNRAIYHLVGYIITTNIKSARALVDESKNLTKQDFLRYLDDCIKKSIEKWIPNANNDGQRTLEDLDYGCPREVKNILLLFNICTMLQQKDETTRFPFDRYKNEKWDIEHIRSQKPNSDLDYGVWRKTILMHFTGAEEEKNFLTRIDSMHDKDAKYLTRRIYEYGKSSNDFDEVYSAFCEYFKIEKNTDDGDIDAVQNLALLNQDINRGYKNKPFPLKRGILLEKDKQGRFIPIGTKNVFLKYYSRHNIHLIDWVKDDMNDYKDEIERVLMKYLSSKTGGVA